MILYKTETIFLLVIIIIIQTQDDENCITKFLHSILCFVDTQSSQENYKIVNVLYHNFLFHFCSTYILLHYILFDIPVWSVYDQICIITKRKENNNGIKITIKMGKMREKGLRVHLRDISEEDILYS